MRKHAFTLPEVLMSTWMLAILAATLTLAFVTAYGAFEHVAAKIELDQRCRLTLERVVPLLTAAMPRSQEAIYAPAAGSEADSIDFCTNQDFLRTPPTVFDPRGNPPGPFHEYVLGQRGTDVVLREVYAVPPAPAEQVIARQVDIRFAREASSTTTLRVTVTAATTVRNARRQTQVQSYTMQTGLGLPAYAR